MPSFVVVPATFEDLENVARVQFDACASDPGFGVIFPKGATANSIEHFTRLFEHDMETDPTCHIMIVKDVKSGDVASYSTWHFFPAMKQHEIEQEMLSDEFPLPEDANLVAGNKLVSAGLRKRHEVVAAQIGIEKPYAYLSAIGTSTKYQKQGAAAMLLQWGIERIDDHGLPAYLEATPAGLSLYQRFGFREVDRLRLETLPWKEGDFFNICMIRPASV